MALDDRQLSGQLTKAEKDYYSTGEIAKMFGVTSRTVSNWCDQGLLPFIAMPSGHRRIPASAIKVGREYNFKLQAFRKRMTTKLAGLPTPNGEEIAAQVQARRKP